MASDEVAYYSQDQLSEDILLKHIAEGSCCIFRFDREHDLAKGLPDSLAGFTETFGRVSLQSLGSKWNAPQIRAFKEACPADWTLADYISSLLDGTAPSCDVKGKAYLQGCSLNQDVLSELRQKFKVPVIRTNTSLKSRFKQLACTLIGLGKAYKSRWEPDEPELFIGGKGFPEEPLCHRDTPRVNIFTYQLVGRKTWTVFPSPNVFSVLHMGCGIDEKRRSYLNDSSRVSTIAKEQDRF